MSLGLVSPLLNRGVRSRWLASLPGAGSKMLTIDSNGDTAFQDIPTAAWGSITGTLSNQTDLQNALNAKLSLSGGTLTGAILIPTGTAGAPSIAFTDDTDAGIYRQTNAINFSIGGTLRQQFQGDGSIVLSGTDPYLIIGTSLALSRDGNDILAQKRATAAQTFRVYNTFTDASNYERAKIAWESNVLRIGSEKAGTGSARAVEIQTDGTTRLTVGATGDVTTAGNLSVGNNSIYLGGSGVIRLADYTRIHTPDSYGPIDIAPMTNNVTGVVRVYNTIRSLTNYERLECGQAYNANAFIRTAAGGTGTRRNLEIDAPEIKIAIATTQKIGFYNATPVVQPAAVADATDAASVITQLNLLLSRMRDLGLIAT